MSSTEIARLGIWEEDYQRFGLKDGNVAIWENGMRMDGSPGTFEWWYLDAHLNDGSTLVTVIHTKPTQNIEAPLTPYLSVVLDRPDGTHIERRIKVDSEEFTSSAVTTDVNLGANSLRKAPAEWLPKNEAVGIYSYDLVIEDEELSIDMGLYAQMPMWRPKTGHFMFGETNYFAWLVPVPYGDIQGHMVINGGRRRYFRGTGYHDHNWGNAPVGDLIRGWEWSRGHAGRCAVLAAKLYPQAQYGSGELPIFLLAQNGGLVTDDPQMVETYTIGNSRVFEYPRFGRDEAHSIGFVDERSLAERSLTQKLAETDLSGELNARTLYRRFTGTMEHRVYEVGKAMTEQVVLGDA